MPETLNFPPDPTFANRIQSFFSGQEVDTPVSSTIIIESLRLGIIERRILGNEARKLPCLEVLPHDRFVPIEIRKKFDARNLKNSSLSICNVCKFSRSSKPCIIYEAALDKM